MSLVVCNAGELLLLEWALKSSSTPENLTLKLYTNDYTPVATSTAGNFTEATFTGYAAKTLTRGSWVAPSTNGSGEAEATYAAQDWEAESAQTVYGYYVVGATSGTLVWAQRFATARSVADGDTLTITPKFTLHSEN